MRRLLVGVLLVLELLIAVQLISGAVPGHSIGCGNHVYGSSVYFGCGMGAGDL